MGGSFIFRENQDSDDAFQRRAGSSYSVTAQTLGLQLQASTVAVATQSMIGFYFNGDIPIGTTSVAYGSITVFTKSGTSAAGTNVPFKIYAQANVSPLALKTSSGAGTADLTAAQRPRTTAFTQINYSLGSGVNDEWVISQDTWKELLTLAGASSFSGTGTALDPYVAANATTSALHNLVFICVADDLTVGASPSSTTCQVSNYDVYTADSSAAKFATFFQSPALNISTVDNLDNVVGTDDRVHWVIIGDSLTWPYAPDLQAGSFGYTRPANSLYTGLDPTGAPITTGIMYWRDGDIDVVPPGFSYGGVNRGYTTVQQGGQWYTIIDPTGSVYNHGQIQPEARSGYTPKGCLKDAMIARKIRDKSVVIHSFGFGGSTAAPIGGTSGVWTNANQTGTRVTLDAITDPTTAISTITNNFWNKNRDQTGKTLVQVLADSTIKYMVVMMSLDGNDLFLGYTSNGKTITLPISTSAAGTVAAAVTQMTADNTTIWNFIKRMRDHYATIPGAITEYHHVGMYNFLCEDPRVPPINVHIGPPTSTSMHRGTYQTLANPDPEYGGPNPSGPGDLMAPYGNSGQASPAASGGPGVVNAMPQVPLTLFYPFGSAGGAIPRPITNIVGQPALCNWTVQRAFTKDDLDIPHQLLMGDRFNKTWVRDFDTNWRDWFAHWAADTVYSANGSFPYNQSATTSGWTTAFGLFQNNPTHTNFPTHSCYGGVGVYNLPLDNMAIAVPYTGRNINNATVNECVQATCSTAAAASITALAGTGAVAQFVDMHDVLPAEVGSGVTASADRWAYVDGGVHPTLAASIQMSHGYLDRILAGGSPLIQKLLAEGHDGMFFAMM